MMQRVHSLITSAVLGSAIGVVVLAAPSQAASLDKSLGKYTFGTPTLSFPSFGFSPSATGVATGVSLSDFTAGEDLDFVGGSLFVGNPAWGIRASNWNGQEDDYFEFILTPDAGKTVTVNTISLDRARTGGLIPGPNSLSIFSSLNNFTSPLISTTVGTTLSNIVLPLSGLNSLTSPIKFRIVATGASERNSSLKALFLDNVELKGSVAAVPTPALLPGLVGLGVAALRKRKGEAAEKEVVKG
jgi:hypothetical protein